MSENKTVSVNLSGLYATLIFITLLVLKVTHIWNISWIWVFSPFWGPIAGIIVVGLVMIVINVHKAKRSRKELKDLMDKYDRTEKQHHSKFSEMLEQQLKEAEEKRQSNNR